MTLARHLALLLLVGWAPAGGAAVGTVPASFGVTPVGAATYDIPITVTPGIGGVTPQLAVSYFGPQERGILGVGFGLAGLSAITPCAKTIAQDGAAAPVLLTAADRYCLDGARLRWVSGTYGDSGATYRTELERFARVTSYDAVNGRPGWFKVETADGRIYEYGHTSDAVFRAGTAPTAPIQIWALNRISDRAGNAIAVVYENSVAERRFRPSSVRYTDSTSQGSGRYQISFVYQAADRPDLVQTIEPSYAGGGSHLETRLLQRLELQHDGTTYRQYLFGYQGGSGANSRLRSVQLCAATTSDCVPETTLDWSVASAGHGAAVAASAVAAPLAPLDLNGDGFEDLVWASSGTWRYMLGTATGYGAAVNSGITATNPDKALPIEWNGDGRMDLLVDWSDGKWRVLAGTAMGLASPVAAGPGGIPSNTANSYWWMADTNGDGRDDLLRAATGVPARLYVRLNGATGFGAETQAFSSFDLKFTGNPFPALSSYGQSSTRRADFDGDGRGDVLIYACMWDAELGQCLISFWYYMVANGTSFTNYGNLYSATYSVSPWLGDFNADGLTDVAYPSPSSAKWCVAFAQGGGGMVGACGPSTAGYNLYGGLAADYDGDGYDDLYVYKTATNLWEVYRSTGTGLATTPIATGLSVASTFSWTATDYNGDGLTDLGRFDSSGGVWRVLPHAGVPGERLTRATDAFGVKVEYTYAPLTDATVYAKGSGAVYPLQDLQRPWGVVKQLTATDATGSGSTYTRSYSYEGARVDLNGRGYLGFAKRTNVDGRLNYNLKTEETYRQDFPYIGRVASAIFKQSNGTRIRELTNTWSTLSLGTGYDTRRYPYPSAVTDKRFELGGTYDGTQHTLIETIVAAVDSTSGLITDHTVKTTEVATGLSAGYYRTERVQHSSVLNDTTNWCLGRPQTTQVTASHTLAGGTAITRTVGHTWDGYYCRPTQQQLEPGSGQWLVTVARGYDGFGNLSSETVTGVGMSARTTTLGWGTRGQYPESLTNALSQPTAQAWNYALGVPTSVTDPNGLSTSWGHDSFGRRTLELRPDLTRTTWDRAPCASGCDTRTRYRLYQYDKDTAGTAYRTTIADLNQFEQAFMVAAQRPGGAYAVTATDSDARGRPIRRYVPHWAGGAHDGYVQLSYDALDRVTAEQLYTAGGALDRSAGYAYNGLAVTQTDPLAHTTTHNRTAWGDLIRATDALGNNTAYEYDAFGQLTKVTDALTNVVSTIIYNVRGMKTAQTDIDLGAWTFTPNALGEVASQTDAKGQTTSFSYDALGRLMSRTDSSGTSTWNWGTSTVDHNVGQLASLAGPGYAESIVYDGYARPQTRTVTIDAAYQYDYGYDTLGRLDTLTYPTSTGGYRLKLAYEYGNGAVTKIKDYNVPATVLWKLGSVDAAGRIIDETLGASIQVVSGFSPLTGVLEYRQSGAGGGSALQNLGYAWNDNDHLTQRQDLNQSLTETFVYDALDRLDYSQRNGVTNLDLAYDAIGNLTAKSDVGSYTYHASKKHAVTAAGSNSYAYDANGNVTTRNGASITWSPTNLPNTINQAGGNYGQFWYGPDGQRVQQVAGDAGTTETTRYAGGLLEKVTRGGLTTWKHYIEAPTGTAALYLRLSSGSPSEKTYYLTHDHLGSTDRVLDADGVVVTVAESFDAYGRRRGSAWSGAPTAADRTAIGNTTRAGFTGHEMLDNLELVHMNGRVYDPVVGRFLSADPYVQAPYASQSLNRYGYVMNGPLSYVDPSGYEACSTPDSCGEAPPGRWWHWVPPALYGPFEGHGRTTRWNAYLADYYAENVATLLTAFGPEVAAQVRARLRDGSLCRGVGGCYAAPRPTVDAPSGAPRPGGPDPHDGRVNFSPQAPGAEGVASQLGEATLNLVPGWYYAGQGNVAIQNDDYIGAVLFYGAAAGDVFLLGRASAATILARTATAEAILAARGIAATGQGFRSHSALTQALGPAGPGQHWHHIVEQTPGNIARFGPQAVHNTGNVMRLDATIHGRISGFYSSIQPFTGGQTVRQWLSSQSFDEQVQFGLDTLRRYGVGP